MNNNIGYKGFEVKQNGTLHCRKKEYRVGEIAEVSGRLKICRNGIHFCWKLKDVHPFYDLTSSAIGEVEILGDVLNDADMKKSCTNRLRLIRLLTKEEVLAMSNSGVSNIGVINSGDWNSGNWNSGNRNSGNWNSGDWNSGNWNSGNLNSGNWNSGNWNSGNRNSGNRNGGNWNSGNWNSGDCNNGNWNSGNWNSGNWNSGNWNSGNWNSGNWNSGDCNNGIFCTDAPTVRMFNKETTITFDELYKSAAWAALTKYKFPLTEWIEYTAEEKKVDKAKELIGGYLKKNDYKDAWRVMWDSMSADEHTAVMSLPNFNAAIFEGITGVKE